MKVVCKNNQKDLMDNEWGFAPDLNNPNFDKNLLLNDALIIDKIYDVLETDVMDFHAPSEIYYLIENERGQTFWYSSNRFITIDKFRDEKLNNIGL